MSSRPLTGNATALALVFLLTCGWLTLPAADLGAQPQMPDSPVVRLAMLDMQKLQASGGQVSRKSFSRYFAVYSTPAEQAEGQRLLGTAERIIRAFARKLYLAAEERARGDGVASIRLGDLRALTERLIPSATTEYKTRVFFPRAAAAERVSVEIIDLEAFGDTPFVWPVLVTLVMSEFQPAGEHLPVENEQAARQLADAVSAYGLLVFRVGGALAKNELAEELASPHLRQAEKAIVQRAKSRPAGEQSDPEALRPVSTSGARFVDVTVESGIRFRHVSSDWISRFRRYGPLAPTYSGGGVAAADLDVDGWPDLIFCGGEGCGVFRNRQDGTFENATGRSGLHVPGEARMPLAADFDNDGDPDVFLTYARDTNRLFENLRGDARRGVTFRDVTEGSGVRRDGDISGPAVAFDFDNDGLLDVYVGNFGDYLREASPWQALDNKNALPNRLYRNLGGLRFEDVTERAGAGDVGWSQALSHVDYDRDGDQDLYVANDFGTNELLINRGDGTFASGGESTGGNDPFHGMNVAFTDLNRDTHADILITNIWGWIPTEREPGEYNTFLLSRKDQGTVAYGRDVERIPGLLEHDTGWSWAGLFFDADHDGDDDLFLLNGLTDYSTFLQWRIHPSREGALYPISNSREKNVFFLNDGEVLAIPAEPSGAELGDFNSRSLALLDYDLDGDLDLAVSTFHSFGRLFRNDAAPARRHWLSVELVGDPTRGTSRDAVGAQVIARGAGGLYVWRTVAGGEGYLGQSTLPVEIGLGEAAEVDLEILWPGQQRQVLEGVPADQAIRVRQGRAGFEKLR
ncbi:MAG: CRTAC1 family protein [bacterium]|nr:CRTAC1 family protein [bacterium]